MGRARAAGVLTTELVWGFFAIVRASEIHGAVIRRHRSSGCSCRRRSAGGWVGRGRGLEVGRASHGRDDSGECHLRRH